MQTFNKYVLNEWQGISGSKLSRRCRRICSKTANGKVVVNSTSSSAVSPKMPSHLTLGSFPGPIWTFLLSHHTYFHFLECEVKWALGSITTNKTNGGAGVPVELFQILKDNAVKVLHSICQQIWKTQQWPQDWKSQFSSQSHRRAVPKNVQTTAPLHLFHILAK